MDISIDENMFNTGKKKRKTSIMIPEKMDDALNKLATMRNESVNDIIKTLLEQALRQLVREGVLQSPKKS